MYEHQEQRIRRATAEAEGLYTAALRLRCAFRAAKSYRPSSGCAKTPSVMRLTQARHIGAKWVCGETKRRPYEPSPDCQREERGSGAKHMTMMQQAAAQFEQRRAQMQYDMRRQKAALRHYGSADSQSPDDFPGRDEILPVRNHHGDTSGDPAT